MRIVLCYPVEDPHLRQIAAVAPDAEIIDAGQEHVAAEIHHADFFCGHPKVPVDWDRVVEAGRLQWIQSSAAGLDHLLVPSVAASDVVVTSASGVLSDQVAEHALALATGWARSLPAFFRAQQRHEYLRLPTRDVHESRITIVGFGGVGRRLVEVFRPLRPYLVGVDLFPDAHPPLADEMLHVDRLDEVLPRTDILLLSAPLTDRSRGMIDARRLALLPRHAVVVNVGRGPLVVEQDLVSALESGAIAGAAIDVAEVEPLPETSRLWDLPNVIITPHVAGQSGRRVDRMTEFFCDNLARWQTQRPLRNLVDKSLGFPRPVRPDSLD